LHSKRSGATAASYAATAVALIALSKHRSQPADTRAQSSSLLQVFAAEPSAAAKEGCSRSRTFEHSTVGITSTQVPLGQRGSCRGTEGVGVGGQVAGPHTRVSASSSACFAFRKSSCARYATAE